MWKSVLVAAALLVLIAENANAITLQIDADANTPGIQSKIDVFTGDSFLIDVLISDAANVIGFQTNGGSFVDDGNPGTLNFDPTLIAATDVLDGGFLTGPFQASSEAIGFGEVSFQRVQDFEFDDGSFVSVLPDSPAGKVFSVKFLANAVGESTIGFGLVNVFGNLDLLTTNDIVQLNAFQIGTVTVQISENPNPPSVVPVPAALPLSASALGILGFINWRRRRTTS